MPTKPTKRKSGNAVLPTPYYDDGNGIVVYLADCREIVPLLYGMVDFVFTDPPFGHSNNDGDLIHNWEKACGRELTEASEARPIANDTAEETNELVQWFFAECPKLLMSGGCYCYCYCCCCCGGGGGPDPQFARWSLWLDEYLSFMQMIVWDKGGQGLGWKYHRSYETVLVAQKPDAAGRWYDDTLKINNIIRPNDYGIRKIIPDASNHPTPKPVALPMHFMRLHTQEGHLVLDPFMGGGSTLRAAKRLKRQAIGIELEKQWCELTVEKLKRDALRPRQRGAIQPTHLATGDDVLDVQ